MEEKNKEDIEKAGDPVHPESVHNAESDHRRFLPPGNDDYASILSVDSESVESEEEDMPSEDACVEKHEASSDSAVEGGEEKEERRGRKFWNIVSHTVSWLMVPMLMPVYGTILIFGLSILSLTSAETRLWLTGIVFGINVLLPALVIVVLKRLGLVGDLGLNERKERFIPYIVSILSLLGTAWFMGVKHAPALFWLFYVGGAVGGIVNLLVNLRWKISAHAAGVAGVLALLIRISSDGFPQGNVMLWLLIWILLAGATGSARLYLERHTFWQVMAGYAVGFVSVYLTTSFGV